MSQPFLGTTQLRLDLLHLKTTNILEFDPLEQIPDAFLWIQLWSVPRQAFQMNPFGSTMRQKIFDRLASMNARSIPNHQQFTGDLARKHLQKANHIAAFVRMVLGLHQDLSFRRNSTDGREMVMGQFDAQDGRLAKGSIRPYCQWQQVKCRLIYENDRTLFAPGLFFSSSHRCSFHLWMAASSRWVAFWMGFCRLCLQARRRRLQWAG